LSEHSVFGCAIVTVQEWPLVQVGTTQLVVLVGQFESLRHSTHAPFPSHTVPWSVHGLPAASFMVAQQPSMQTSVSH
jgi:hypothetical protein